MLLDLAGGWSDPVHISPLSRSRLEPPLAAVSAAWIAKSGGGGVMVPGLRHGGFFSGGRTATFILPSNLLYLYSFCGNPPARKNTNIFVNYKLQGAEGN